MLICGLFHEAICFMSYVLRLVLSYSLDFSLTFFTLSYFVLVLFFSSPFSIAITPLGEERANLCAFLTFVRFALVWFCLFTLPLGV